MILSPAAVANAIFNAIGSRMKDLPITRDKILGALRMKDFANANAARRRSRPSRSRRQAQQDGQTRRRSPAAAATCWGWSRNGSSSPT